MTRRSSPAFAAADPALVPTEAMIDAGCDAMEALLRTRADFEPKALGWREAGAEKPHELNFLRRVIAAIQASALAKARGERS